MKAIRTISLLLVLLFATTTLSGCHKIEAQQKIDRMLDYINAKYTDDSFTYVSVTGGHLGSNVTKIIVNSEKYPEKGIRVICTEVDGSEKFADTYLNIKFEQETRAYIENALCEEYGTNIYVKYTPGDVAVEDNGTSDTTFSEYLVNENTYISFSAVVSGVVMDEEKTFENIKAMFSDAVIRGNIYYVEENVELSGENSSKTAQQYIETQTYSKRLYFVKESIDNYSRVEWTEGV